MDASHRPYLAAPLALLIALGCNDGGDPTSKPVPEPAVVPVMAADAGPADAAPSGRAHVATPASGYHLDETPDQGRTRLTAAPPRRARKTIHIILKSSPSGAVAAVDGVTVGRTPAFWEGDVTGKPREFTFVLPGYVMARYRFVPTTSGVVHGRLEKLAVERADAGVAEPEPEP